MKITTPVAALTEISLVSVLFVSLIAICSIEKSSKSKQESWYRDKLASYVSGTTEQPCWHGRIDVATTCTVYEIDFLHKHKECLGQAQWYGWCTGKKPVMALIVPIGEWRDFIEIKKFVESNSTVRVVALDELTGSVMVEYRW